ncbi:uncharacterized protein [Zea mays]|nr:uncharacterized protein LOC111589940 isoform X4 [Zea mays]
MHDVQDLPAVGQHRLQERLHHHQEPSLQAYYNRSQNNQTRMEIPWKRYRASKFQPMMRELDWMFMLQVYYLLHEHG